MVRDTLASMPPDSEGQQSQRVERERLYGTIAQLEQDLEYLPALGPSSPIWSPGENGKGDHEPAGGSH